LLLLARLELRPREVSALTLNDTGWNELQENQGMALATDVSMMKGGD